jgi:hypothetical protein
MLPLLGLSAGFLACAFALGGKAIRLARLMAFIGGAGLGVAVALYI